LQIIKKKHRGICIVVIAIIIGSLLAVIVGAEYLIHKSKSIKELAGKVEGNYVSQQ
jgi:Ca2+/Na+ antiporter